MRHKQYTLEVYGLSGKLLYQEDYYDKEDLKNDLLSWNPEYTDIKVYFSKFDGTDEFIELDAERL